MLHNRLLYCPVIFETQKAKCTMVRDILWDEVYWKIWRGGFYTSPPAHARSTRQHPLEHVFDQADDLRAWINEAGLYMRPSAALGASQARRHTNYGLLAFRLADGHRERETGICAMLGLSSCPDMPGLRRSCLRP